MTTFSSAYLELFMLLLAVRKLLHICLSPRSQWRTCHGRDEVSCWSCWIVSVLNFVS
ncbi:hypothetical protein FA95DRAFT_693948 [Auriscalpium vulgare]|uniref:Uncharacterized protein n=1 Tax=Auriscalpium vulgare TaxID=40419 RepID=A0ACB8RBB8_9AGAM|nr:hypothetical protein FA95DRAFT_693948 [Auriscalpium vulgare]